MAVTGDDNPTVGIDDQILGLGGCGAKAGGDLAAGTEGGVQAAVLVVAGNGDLAATTVIAVAGNDNLTVAVDDHADSLIIRSVEGGGELAAGAEGGVQATVLIKAGQRK